MCKRGGEGRHRPLGRCGAHWASRQCALSARGEEREIGMWRHVTRVGVDGACARTSSRRTRADTHDIGHAVEMGS